MTSDYYDYDDEDYNQDGQCIVRQCNQQITGRRLTYDRALEIIQEEEYLDEADFDNIRRQKRQASDCPSHWTYVQDVGCYLAASDSSSIPWKEALQYCRYKGGTLAEPTNSLIQSTLENLADDSTRWWIGATDAVLEGNFKWLSGAEWSYTNWGSGQPDNWPAAGGEDQNLEEHGMMYHVMVTLLSLFANIHIQASELSLCFSACASQLTLLSFYEYNIYFIADYRITRDNDITEDIEEAISEVLEALSEAAAPAAASTGTVASAAIAANPPLPMISANGVPPGKYKLTPYAQSL